MKKAFNIIGIIVLVVSCLGIGYIFKINKEVKNTAQTMRIPSPQEIPNTIRILSSIQYGKDARQSLDIYLPPGRGNFPVIFFQHGGVWSSGHKDMYGSIGYFYAKNGYVTIVSQHRLSPQVSHPHHIEDVAKAYAWVKKNISNYGGDSNRIYFCGHSSGAHLLSLLVTNKKYLTKEGVDRSGIRGVIAISGIYSLGINIDIAGYGHVFPTSEDKRDASPVNFIDKDLPPFLVLYADNDITTLGWQATNFHNLLTLFGVKSLLVRVKEENHATILFDCVTPNRSSKTVLDFMK